jgi:hypothetical protein
MRLLAAPDRKSGDAYSKLLFDHGHLSLLIQESETAFSFARSHETEKMLLRSSILS